MSTDRSTELAATLAKLASLLVEQDADKPTPPQPQSRTVPDRVLLTVEEAAEQLGVGRTKTYELVKHGEIESVQIGRLRRVPVSAIKDYAARLVNQRSTTKRSA